MDDQALFEGSVVLSDEDGPEESKKKKQSKNKPMTHQSSPKQPRNEVIDCNFL